MKKILITVFLTAALQTILSAQVRPVNEIDTPTAFTLGKSAYQVSLFAYDEGGIELKTIIGLHDMVHLGVSFDIENLIGTRKPHPNIPGVILKIKFTDGPEKFPISVGMGYDSFFIGKQGRKKNPYNDLNRITYGPYFVITKPVYILDSEQYISFGFRIPTQPYFTIKDTSYFLSFDVPISMFNIKAEMERVYWDFRHPDEWLFNFGVRYTYLEQFSLEFDILVEPRVRIPNRVLKVEYRGEF